MSPINKPYDRLAKELADEAPELLVRILSGLREGATISIRHLRPETSPPVRLVDKIAAVALDNSTEFILHIEFCVSFDQNVLTVIARYGGSLATQYDDRRIDSVLVLLDRRRGSAAIPDLSRFANHGTMIIHPFRTVRMWEQDAAPVLESGDLRLLSWTVVMNSTHEQVLDVAARVRACGDEEVVARFLTLGSLRYDRNELERMLGGAHMGLMEAIMEGSSLVQDIKERVAREAAEKARQLGLEAGHQQGLEQGREQGLEQGRRDMLRAALRDRFPGLESHSSIDALYGQEVIARLLAAAFTCTDRAELERLIHEAARPH